MNEYSTIILAVLAVAYTASVATAQQSLCPKHCNCDQERQAMRCTHLRDGIPQPFGGQSSFFENGAHLSTLIVHRAIFANPVLSMSNFSHPLFAGLADLAFTMTNIEEIQTRAFEGLPKLSRLVFKYNNDLNKVESEAFFGLNLHLLQFHESPQLSIDDDTVFLETRTKNLAVTKCGLELFNYDVFHLLLKISLPMRSLDLEGNAFTKVDQRFSSLFTNISRINLENNPLTCNEDNFWLYTVFRRNPNRFRSEFSEVCFNKFFY